MKRFLAMFKLSTSSLLTIVLGLALGCGVAAYAQVATSIPTVSKTVGQTARLSWTAPTTYTDGSAIASGTVITYNVYGAAQAAGTTCGTPAFGKPTASAVSGTGWTTPAYTATGVWCYTTTSLVAGTESAPSNIVQVNVTPPIPNPPSAVTVQ